MPVNLRGYLKVWAIARNQTYSGRQKPEQSSNLERNLISILKSFHKERYPGPTSFAVKFYQTLKKQIIPNLRKSFQNLEKEGALLQWDESCPPQVGVQLLTPIPVNVTAFRNRIFADMIKIEVIWVLEWTLKPMTGVL